MINWTVFHVFLHLLPVCSFGVILFFLLLLTILCPILYTFSYLFALCLFISHFLLPIGFLVHRLRVSFLLLRHENYFSYEFVKIFSINIKSVSYFSLINLFNIILFQLPQQFFLWTFDLIFHSIFWLCMNCSLNFIFFS